MPGPSQQLQQAVKDIASWLVRTPNPGEATVRQAIVLRLLQAAGFDIWNPLEVIPEETDRAGFRPDLRVVAGSHEFVLELKGMIVGLHERDYQQVASYAGGKGIRWAMLTDGRVWVVIDEHLQGPYPAREVLKLELPQSDLDAFTSDISYLLDSQMWRTGKFEEVVRRIRTSQEERRDVARIRKQKRPIVEAAQEEFGIGTFENAALESVKMGLITEVERDILLSNTQLHQAAADENADTKKPVIENPDVTPTTDAVIEFWYRFEDAEAKAIYFPVTGIWRVQSGSTTSSGLRPYARTAEQQRRKLIEENSAKQLDDGRLLYTKDVDYRSPSTPADVISGASKNGWAVWIDEQGRPAQFHRPEPKP